jgi:hypothetical protein
VRRVALVLVVLAIGCARPHRKRFTDQLASVGQRLVAVVKSGAVKVDANAAIKAAAKTPPPAQRVREEPPPPAQRPDPQQTEPPPAQPAPAPDVKVTRIDASRPTQFVLRGERHDGKDFCEAFTTMESCTSACTNMLRPGMFAKPGPESPKGCACTEQDAGC